MGWLSGWDYRKSHKIEGSSAGAVTDYQVRIKAHYGVGTDSGEDVYLNEHCRTDFGDIRFTSDDGVTELSYWMEEKVDGDYAIFWVKVPSIPASPDTATIYIYYGKSDAVTTSNGENTFVQFHNFEDGTTEGLTNIAGIWKASVDAVHDGDYGLEQSEASGNRRAYWATSLGVPTFAVHCWMQDPVNSAYLFIYLRSSADTAGWIVGWSAYYNRFRIGARTDGATAVGSDSDKAHTFNSGVWYKTIIYYKGDGTIRIEADSDYFEVTRTENYAPDQIGVWCGYNKYWDTIFVRKYVDPKNDSDLYR